jgi:hypothetical protein
MQQAVLYFQIEKCHALLSVRVVSMESPLRFFVAERATIATWNSNPLGVFYVLKTASRFPGSER